MTTLLLLASHLVFFAPIVASLQGSSASNLAAIASDIVATGYRHDAAALQAGLEKLDSASADSHLVDYWRGFAHMRLAEITSQKTGIEVEKHIIAAVAALEAAVAADADFSDGYALLAHVNDWQMTFHHDNKGYYAGRTERFLSRAAELAPSNPRVVLFQGLDLFNTPEIYGGSPTRALKTYRQALNLFADEADSGTAAIDPSWGVMDTHIAMGNVQVVLGDLTGARSSYEAASKLAPACIQAARGLAALARSERLSAGPELASEPIPAPIAPGGDGWHCWRGPDRGGTTSDSSWSTTGIELWRRETGLGYSGLSVTGGRLFTKGYDIDAACDVVRALDAQTGEELWWYDSPAALWNDMHEGGTLSAPVVDDDRVYVLNREGHVHCFAAADGEIQWYRELIDEEALQVSRWGFAASPLILGDQLILNVGRVLSLDKHTGKRRWRTRYYGDAYSTPTPFLKEAAPHMAVFVADGLVIVDPRTGKQLAIHEWKTQYDQNCASPLMVGDDIFVSSGMNRGCALFTYDKGELTPLWSSKAMRNTMSASVTDGDAIYGFDNRVLRCVTVEGESRWSKRGVGWGALSRAGNRLLAITEGGELLIVKATAKSYVELANEQIFDEGKGWTAPVLVDGLLYLRNSKGELVCRDHRLQ
jgi:outer membrane protein assembly factor BamB